MDTMILAKHFLDVVMPFLPELMSPSSLTWFESSNKDAGKRELAEKFWQTLSPKILCRPDTIDLLRKMSSTPHNIIIYNNLVSQLAQILERDSQLQLVLTSHAQQKNIGSVGIGGNVTKSNIIMGSGNTVTTTNYTVSVGNIKQMIINQGGVNRSAKINDVWINLTLPGGRYPTFYWLDRSGVYSALGEKTWWKPEEYSYDQLMEILMKEINNWTNNGWEIIETDLDKLWVVDYGYSETFFSWLTRAVFPAGTILTHWRRYKGAQFHVRRFI